MGKTTNLNWLVGCLPSTAFETTGPQAPNCTLLFCQVLGRPENQFRQATGHGTFLCGPAFVTLELLKPPRNNWGKTMAVVGLITFQLNPGGSYKDPYNGLLSKEV